MLLMAMMKHCFSIMTIRTQVSKEMFQRGNCNVGVFLSFKWSNYLSTKSEKQCSFSMG